MNEELIDNILERILIAVEYAKESHHYKRAIEVIEMILNGKTDEEIMKNE